MKSFKFIQFADLHMDYPFENMPSQPDTGTLRRIDQKKTFDKILKIAAEREVDFIISAGDLYEHSYISEESIKYMSDGFAKCKATVVLLPGNHDPYLKDSAYMRTHWSENVTILAEEKADALFADKELMIHGVGFDRYTMTGEIVLPEITESPYFHILAFHGNVCDCRGTYYNVSADDLLATNADYIAAGHEHQCKINIGGENKINRSGSPEALCFEEAGEHGIIFGEVSVDEKGEASVRTEFIAVSQKKYAMLYIDTGKDYSEERIVSCVRNALPIGYWECSASDIMARCVVAVEPNISEEEIKRIERILKKIFFRCKVEYVLVAGTDCKVIPELEAAAASNCLLGRFARKIAAELKKTDDIAKQKILMRAYEIGTEALMQ